MRSVQEYKRILKTKGFYFCWQEVRKRIFRLRWVRNLQIVDLLEEERVYRKVGRYARVIRGFDYNTPMQDNPFPDKIWVLWLQGVEAAPILVQKCIESIREHSCGREVIVLTNDNLRHYITFPDYIERKFAKGSISRTHLSDLIRIELLAQYGGTWIDSTVLMTGDLPDYITRSSLFMFKSSYVSVGSTVASSWFIHSEASHPLVVQTRDMLFNYWKHERHLAHYFLFHLAFAYVCNMNERNRQLWKAVPHYNNANPHTLQFELFDTYSPQRFEEICRFSPIHKLTYKSLKTNKLMGDTNYDFIFNK